MEKLPVFINECLHLVNDELIKYTSHLKGPDTLRESMEYSLKAGGKRIRPLLLFATLAAFKKDIHAGLPVACAIEMIHTYSLIHDDLPSMDNDDLRRGKPTNHKVFGEALAILAGDGLLTYSFEIISNMEVSDSKKIQLIRLLAKASGPEGMVAGQVADIEGENKKLTLQELEYIHEHKTGKMLIYPVVAAAILADANQSTIEQLEKFAYHIGLAFQIRDDILDIEGTKETLGKTAGIDHTNNKSTYPNLLTLDGAKKKLSEHIILAKEALSALELNTGYLLYITDLIEKRNS